MGKKMTLLLAGFIFLIGIFGVVDAISAQTVTPTETILATTPSVSPTVAVPTASASAGPTNITSLPKTGFMQYGIMFVVVSVGVIIFSLVF